MPLLYEQVADHIRQAIRAGVSKPGDQLATEQELARELGVSRITIKRAMSILERQGLIERFRGRGTFVTAQAPRVLGQGPDPESQATPETRVERFQIGFMIPEVSDLFGVRMLNGIDDRCRELDLDLCIRRTHGSAELEAATIRAWVSSGMDGLIVFPCHGEYYNEALLQVVLNRFPVVLVDRTLNGIPVPSVMTDNRAAARTLTAWLVDQGHTGIAFASPDVRGTSSLEDRLAGYVAAMREIEGADVARTAHLRLDSVLPGHDQPGAHERDLGLTTAFLHEHAGITALVASEYSLAVLLERAIGSDPALRQRDITIACFDSFSPSLTLQRYTHIEQDEVAMGRMAVDLLMDQTRGERPVGRNYVDFALRTHP